MSKIDGAVRKRLEAKPGQEEAVALWARLWNAFEKEGREGVEALLEEMAVDGRPKANVGGDEP